MINTYESLKENIMPIFNSLVYRENFQFSNTWEKEDFLQDVLEKVWRNYEKFDISKGSFSTWFCVIGRTVYYNHYNKMKRQAPTSYMEEETFEKADKETCDGIYIKAETKESLRREVDELPQKYAEVIRLTYFEELSASEIAEKMQCKEMDVYRWRNRALNKLRESIENKNLKDDLYDGLAA